MNGSRLVLHEPRDEGFVLKFDKPWEGEFCGNARSSKIKILIGCTIGECGLIAFISADGIHWRKLREKPVFRKGRLDSQNVSFWSESEQCYLCYFRTSSGKGHGEFRSVCRTTSKNFKHWTVPVFHGLRRHSY